MFNCLNLKCTQCDLYSTRQKLATSILNIVLFDFEIYNPLHNINTYLIFMSALITDVVIITVFLFGQHFYNIINLSNTY